jgi:hypothetical protein
MLLVPCSILLLLVMRDARGRPSSTGAPQESKEIDRAVLNAQVPGDSLYQVLLKGFGGSYL